MKPTPPIRLVLLAVLGAASPALAQSGGPYELTWHSVPGGATGAATGGGYSLAGSSGQAAAVELAGGAYVLAAGFWAGAASHTVGVGPRPDATPRAFAARAAGPNPFADATALHFDLPARREVSVAVYGLDGRIVRHLLEGAREAGRHLVHWDGRDHAGRSVQPGVYFVRVEAGSERSSLRLVRLH